MLTIIYQGTRAALLKPQSLPLAPNQSLLFAVDSFPCSFPIHLYALLIIVVIRLSLFVCRYRITATLLCFEQIASPPTRSLSVRQCTYHTFIIAFL